MDTGAFFSKFGGNPNRYGLPPTVGGGAPTPRSQTTDGGPDSGSVPITTEPGYMGVSSVSTGSSKDSGPA